MISEFKLDTAFNAVPYFTSSMLWDNNAIENRLEFSTEKPNVIVGPNGSGKTALLTLLSIQSLTHFTGESALDDNFTRSHESDSWWSEKTWRNEPQFLPGAEFITDNGPAVFYRPGHISGNDDSVSAAMMCGYFNEAKAYAAAVDKRSAGQGCQALLAKFIAALDGTHRFSYRYSNWGAGKEPIDLSKQSWSGPWDYRAEVLKKRLASVSADAIPLILLDEPEQSLDAKAELQLWKAIASTDCSKRQVVVATHSLYPFLNPGAFNIIEAIPGYVQCVRDELGMVIPVQH